MSKDRDKERDHSKSARRQEIHDRRRKEGQRRMLIFGGLGALALALIGFFIWQVVGQRPSGEVGEVIAVPPEYVNHIAIGTIPGPYPSDPPAGGVHYPQTFDAKFYEETDLASLPEHPEGYLVHNLEHGYVIFWYNCDKLSQSDCDTLKSQIRQVMADFNGVKLIAFPWKTLDVPLVMTSWGRLQRFETFDKDLASRFIRSNLNHSPEPNAS